MRVIFIFIFIFCFECSFAQKVFFKQISRDSIIEISGKVYEFQESVVVDIFIENKADYPILIPKISQEDLSGSSSDSLISISLDYPDFMRNQGFKLNYYLLQGSTAIKHTIKRKKNLNNIKSINVYFSILYVEFFNRKMLKLLKKGIIRNDILLPDTFLKKKYAKKLPSNIIINYGYSFKIPIP